MMGKFKYLQLSLVVILAFVGVKMILLHHFHIAEWGPLVVVIGILELGIIGSLTKKVRVVLK